MNEQDGKRVNLQQVDRECRASLARSRARRAYPNDGFRLTWQDWVGGILMALIVLAFLLSLKALVG